jgi:hypothetical protein
MFRVDVDSLQEYFDFDPARRGDLESLDQLIRRSAPKLKRHFHRGTPEGEPGMRFRMIGYGKFEYAARTGPMVEWPVVGVALQKNYISVYLAAMRGGVGLVEQYAGKLGEARAGRNNFSFGTFADLNVAVLGGLFAEAERVFLEDPSQCRYGRGGVAAR